MGEREREGGEECEAKVVPVKSLKRSPTSTRASGPSRKSGPKEAEQFPVAPTGEQQQVGQLFCGLQNAARQQQQQQQERRHQYL